MHAAGEWTAGARWLRYDDDRKRVIASLLADVVNLDISERSLAKEISYRYEVSSAVHCSGDRVQVLPPGSRVLCNVVTASGRSYPLKLLVVAKLWPHTMALPIRELRERLNPEFVRLRRTMDAAFRNSPHTVPGNAVANFIKYEDIPLMRILNPKAQYRRTWCPAHLDVSGTTLATAGSFFSSCQVESAFGVIRLAIFTLDGKSVTTQSLSRPFDIRRFARTAAAQRDRVLRSHGSPDLAKIDCGPYRYVALYLSSVYYCQVSYSSGKRGRIGIEYYDPFEGPQAVWEANPTANATQSGG